MGVLRCRTPELVQKELWIHILAYNLIRTIAAQTATRHGIEPRTISFKGGVQTLEAFQPVITMHGETDAASCRVFYEHLLDTQPVALKASNQLGIYDMSGNIREWCQDVFTPDNKRIPQHSTA